MSYDVERRVLNNHVQAAGFYGMSPFALDGDKIKLQAGAGFMAILPGQGRQASTGAPGANLHDYIGVLSITIITDGGIGSGAGKSIADTIIADLTGRKLDETGAAPSASSSMVIDFGRNGLVPYISSSRGEAPHHRTVVSAPFVRTERK